jgi:hypothetical protein
MRLFEFAFFEDVSSEASLRNIIDVLTVQLPQLYHGLGIMAEKLHANNGSLDSLNFVSGGRKSEWYNNIYFKSMKPALYNYAKSLRPADKAELQKHLGTNDNNFNGIVQFILPALGKIANSTKNAKLLDATRATENAIQRYDKKIAELSAMGDEEDDFEEPRPREQNLIPQQNVAVDNIIQDTLSRLPRGVAGEIRNAIARKGNKLLALQQELAARGINL